MADDKNIKLNTAIKIKSEESGERRRAARFNAQI